MIKKNDLDKQDFDRMLEQVKVEEMRLDQEDREQAEQARKLTILKVHGTIDERTQ